MSCLTHSLFTPLSPYSSKSEQFHDSSACLTFPEVYKVALLVMDPEMKDATFTGYWQCSFYIPHTYKQFEKSSVYEYNDHSHGVCFSHR